MFLVLKFSILRHRIPVNYIKHSLLSVHTSEHPDIRARVEQAFEFKIFLSIHFYFIVCVHVCHSMQVEVKEQHFEVDSFTDRSLQGSSSSPQAWQKSPYLLNSKQQKNNHLFFENCLHECNHPIYPSLLLLCLTTIFPSKGHVFFKLSN